jgi:hypothetical protein
MAPYAPHRCGRYFPSRWCSQCFLASTHRPATPPLRREHARSQSRFAFKTTGRPGASPRSRTAASSTIGTPASAAQAWSTYVGCAGPLGITGRPGAEARASSAWGRAAAYVFVFIARARATGGLTAEGTIEGSTLGRGSTTGASAARPSCASTCRAGTGSSREQTPPRRGVLGGGGPPGPFLPDRPSKSGFPLCRSRRCGWRSGASLRLAGL